MAKSREVVSISEIARQYGISRQSVRNWVERHEDFPSPIVADGCKFTVGKGDKAINFTVNDPGQRTKYFDATLVKQWVKDHGQSLRSQGGGAAAKPAKAKAAPKKAAKGKAKTSAKVTKAEKPKSTKSKSSKPTKKAAPKTSTKKTAPAKAAGGKKKSAGKKKTSKKG